MKINQLDLNLLIILKQLLEEKHISNTALTLGISQPSISRSLGKLRKLFDDQLLIRMSGAYQLTPKAESIQQELNSILNKVEVLVNKQNFSPKTTEATIKIFGLPPQMNQLLEMTIGEIRSQAPKMTLDIDTLPKPHFLDLLKGDIHFVVTAHEPTSSGDKLYRIPLFKRRFMLLMSKKHRLAKTPLTTELLRHCHFGQVSVQGEKELSIARCFEAIGVDNVATPVRLKDFSTIGTIAENTDMIFHLPDHFVDDFCRRYNVIAREVPNEFAIGLTQVYLYWHQRYHNDPVCQWLRELIKKQVSTK